jgi:hypothetical protein
MVQGVETFKDFYEGDSKHRKLTWCAAPPLAPACCLLAVRAGGARGWARQREPAAQASPPRAAARLRVVPPPPPQHLHPHATRRRYHALGSCSVKGFFDKKPIEMQMSPLQATILMLFNDAAEMSYKEIQERANMPDEDLVRCAQQIGERV